MQKVSHWLAKRASPQNWFVFIALIFGGLFAVTTPAFLGGDEVYHFTRAYHVADGNLVAAKTVHGTGGEVPISIFDVHAYHDKNHSRPSNIKAAIVHYPLKPQEKMFVAFPHTAVNNPLMYAPQALAIRTGVLFEAPPTLLLYFARLANLVFYVCALYLAIRIIPFGKIAMMVVALLPMHIVSASSASADTFTVAIAALFIASVLYLCTRATVLSLRGTLLFLLLVIAMALTKLPMPLFLLLALLIPPRVLGGSRKNWGVIAAIAAGLACIVGGGWMIIIQLTLSPYGPAGVNVAEQLQFIVHNPFHFLLAALTTYTSSLSNALFHAYPIALPPPGTVFPLWLAGAYTVFLATLFPVAAGAHAWNDRSKLFVGGLILLFFIGVAGLLYLSWTPVGAAHIDGIQPRYLTPLIFLLIPLSSTLKPLSKFNLQSQKWYYILPVLFLIYAMWLIISGFYL